MYQMRRMRLTRNWTQMDVAQQLGISVQIYRRIERGENAKIPIWLLCALGDLYETDLDTLFRVEEKDCHA